MYLVEKRKVIVCILRNESDEEALEIHLVVKAFMPCAFGRDKSLPYKGFLRELRFFAETFWREAPRGDTAVLVQNDKCAARRVRRTRELRIIPNRNPLTGWVLFR